jgi:hypothetical protein
LAGARITQAPVAPVDPVVPDPVTELLKEFPTMLASALARIPAPVIASRPPGAWVIDVKRDMHGDLKQMTAKFHETK